MCDQCEVYKNSTDDYKKELQQKFGMHIKNKNEKAKAFKEADRKYANDNKEKTSFVFFDFQKKLNSSQF